MFGIIELDIVKYLVVGYAVAINRVAALARPGITRPQES